MTALLAGLSVFLIASAVRQPATSAVVAAYVSGSVVEPPLVRRPLIPEAAVLWAGIGAVLGSVLLPLPWSLGLMLGAGSGLIGQLALDRRRRLRRRRRLGFELPAIADLLALYLLAGESVHGALRRVCDEASGVAVTEMTQAAESIRLGAGLVEAMHDVAASSVHPDAARLYELLAQAHETGARLVDALEILAADRRSALARDMTEEGGRRALVGYGPILGLMIPTTLAFLIYPTLAGLDALAAAP